MVKLKDLKSKDDRYGYYINASFVNVSQPDKFDALCCSLINKY